MAIRRDRCPTGRGSGCQFGCRWRRAGRGRPGWLPTDYARV